MEEQRRIRLERLLDEFDRLGIGRQVNYGRLRLYSIITHSTDGNGRVALPITQASRFHGR